MRNQFMLSPFLLDQPLAGADRLGSPDWHINRPALDGGDQFARIHQVQRPLADFVAEAVRDDERPVAVGGDCCAAIAVIAGLQRAGIDPAIVWLDAHGDFNTWETTPSGFVGGMPLAMLVGRGDQTLLRLLGVRPIPETDVILTDARDLDPGEGELLRQSKVRHVRDVASVPSLLPPGRPVYVHFDMDVLDPSDAPAMLYPTPGGPSLAILRDLAEQLAESGRVLAASATVWAIDRDQDRRTERACLSVLETLVGEAS